MYKIITLILLQLTELHTDTFAADSNFLRAWNFVHLCPPKEACPAFYLLSCSTQ